MYNFWFYAINHRVSISFSSSGAVAIVLKCSGGGISPTDELAVQVFQEGQL